MEPETKKKSQNISYQPTEGLSYNPNEAIYWDPSGLKKEVLRTFEICHGCRMCFKYCDTFPSLFDFIDRRHEGHVGKLTDGEIRTAMDQCFQCKLCEVQCPYTVRDQHAYKLDFPSLVHRYQAVKQKKKLAFSLRGLRDFLLARPNVVGFMSRLSLGMVNTMNRSKLHRWFLDKTLGIHSKKLLPPFARRTFEAWAKRKGYITLSRQVETVLFQTCYVQNNEPSIGRDALTVMKRNQIECQCVENLSCCGMPAWEKGDLKALRKSALHNLNLLSPFVAAGAKVLVINPTCSMIMRREYPALVPKEHRQKAEKLAQSISDACEYLWSIRKEERFNTAFESSPEGKIAYHAPCHLRTQAIGFPGRDILKKLPDVEVNMVMECCGHDGTHAMKTETFEASKRIGEKAFLGMKSQGGEVWASECPLAAIQFQQHAGIKPMHPLSILARAYEGKDFSSPTTKT